MISMQIVQLWFSILETQRYHLGIFDLVDAQAPSQINWIRISMDGAHRLRASEASRGMLMHIQDSETYRVGETQELQANLTDFSILLNAYQKQE